MANEKKENIDNKSKKTTTKRTSSSTKKTTPSKKTTTTKKSTTTKKTTSSKTTSNKSESLKNTVKKPVTKTTTAKKTTTNKTTKTAPKKKVEVDKRELEKTIIIENIETEIDNILNKKDKIEEQVIEKINNVDVAKIENAKFQTKKRDRKLLGIGIIISLLGIIALVIALIANRIIDREFISDSTVSLMVIVSIIIECFGAFIIINEV